MVSTSYSKTAVMKALRQIPDVGLQRIVDHNGKMLLDGFIYNKKLKCG